MSGAHASIGNQARLKPLRAGAANGRGRCGAGEPCEHDEGRPRDLLGIATWNATTGVVDASVFHEHCGRDCVAQHEKTHAQDEVADKVMRMPDLALSFSAAPPKAQRKCAGFEVEEKKNPWWIVR